MRLLAFFGRSTAICRLPRSILLMAVAVSLCWTGCGKNDRPALGQVKGTVMLDGEPLANANVSFSPKEGGRTSTAVTNDNGEYELNYNTKDKGAKIGEHDVRVSTFQQGGDEPGSPEGVKELVPAKYQKSGAITEAVDAGENTINLELSSK